MCVCGVCVEGVYDSVHMHVYIICVVRVSVQAKIQHVKSIIIIMLGLRYTDFCQATVITQPRKSEHTII